MADRDAPFIDQALADPEAIFGDPEKVLESDQLDPAQKAEVLRRWEYDRREMQVATEEGMGRAGGDDPNDLLYRIERALGALGDAAGPRSGAPTKQGG